MDLKLTLLLNSNALSNRKINKRKLSNYIWDKLRSKNEV